MDDSDKDLRGGGFSDFGSDDTMDIVAYIVMILGILFTFFDSTVGGVLAGLVMGIYFCDEIVGRLKSVEGLYREYGTVRSLLLGGAAIALLIVYPTFFVSAVVVGFITNLVKPKAKKVKPSSSEED